MKKILELTLIVAGAVALTLGCSQNAGDSAETELISLKVTGMT